MNQGILEKIAEFEAGLITAHELAVFVQDLVDRTSRESFDLGKATMYQVLEETQDQFRNEGRI